MIHRDICRNYLIWKTTANIAPHTALQYWTTATTTIFNRIRWTAIFQATRPILQYYYTQVKLSPASPPHLPCTPHLSLPHSPHSPHSPTLPTLPLPTLPPPLMNILDPRTAGLSRAGSALIFVRPNTAAVSLRRTHTHTSCGGLTRPAPDRYVFATLK